MALPEGSGGASLATLVEGHCQHSSQVACETKCDFIPILFFFFSQNGKLCLAPEHLGVFHTIFKTILLGGQIPRSKRNKVGRNTHGELPACLIPYAPLVFWSN